MTTLTKTGSNFNSAIMTWDNEDITSSLKYLESQQSTSLNHLTELLNSYHGWNRSPAYYDFLCGGWLLHFSHATYAAYLEVTSKGGVSLDQSPIPVLRDCDHYLKVSATSLSFNNQLGSLIFEVLKTKTGIAKSFSERRVELSTGKTDVRGKVKRIILNAATRLLGDSKAPFVFCQPHLGWVGSEWLSVLWKWRKWARHEDYSYPISVMAEIDSDWRSKQSKTVSVKTFTDVLQALLPLYTPVIYLEGLSAYRQKAHSFNFPRPKVIYTAYGLHRNPLFKTLAADWREEGTKLLNHQHGGCYGIDLIHVAENYEIRQADRFYSFGWHSKDPKVKPLPQYLPNPPATHDRPSDILLVMTILPPFVYRIQFGSMPSSVVAMIQETVDLISEVGDCPELLVRPYFHDYGWRVLDSLRKKNPNIRLDDSRKPSMKSFQQSALVVHNYLGTSYLETLAMNIPTVCFYNPTDYAFRDEVKPYIDDLVKVGIIHQSGAAAGQFVSDVKSDIQGWWKKPEVQSARQAFVRNYANFSVDWVTHWEAEFKQWID